MFDQLSARLSAASHVAGPRPADRRKYRRTLREVRIALLEADVALPVVEALYRSGQAAGTGTEVSASLNPDRPDRHPAPRARERARGRWSGAEPECAAPLVILLAVSRVRQDHDRRQARALADHGTQAARTAREHRRAASGAILQLERLSGQVNADFFGPGGLARGHRAAALSQAQRRLRR